MESAEELVGSIRSKMRGNIAGFEVVSRYINNLSFADFQICLYELLMGGQFRNSISLFFRCYLKFCIFGLFIC